MCDNVSRASRSLCIGPEGTLPLELRRRDDQVRSSFTCVRDSRAVMVPRSRHSCVLHSAHPLQRARASTQAAALECIWSEALDERDLTSSTRAVPESIGGHGHPVGGR